MIEIDLDHRGGVPREAETAAHLGVHARGDVAHRGGIALTIPTIV